MFWNISQARQSQQQTNLEDSRSIFKLLVEIRSWNAQMGGVYVPVTDQIQPNLYLDVPNRDITTSDGQKLTLINPANMTRMISELATEKDQVTFHITSLKPIRPQNAPDIWETSALMAFQTKGQKEFYDYQNIGGTDSFRYMAPLITTESCLQCHAKQGYQVGDIRGGISVTFPEKIKTPWAIIISHLLIGLMGSIVIFKYGKEIDKNIQTLETESIIDGLTRIHNRRYFDLTLNNEFLHSRRNKNPMAIMICDIDNFKLFNDTYGHQAGDECLKKVAQSLSSGLKRPGDLCARIGGEEFGIILPYTDIEGAQVIGNLLQAKVESLKILHSINKASDFVTVSIGVAIYSGENNSLAELFNRADRALYKAKSSGKNTVFYEDPEVV